MTTDIERQLKSLENQAEAEASELMLLATIVRTQGDAIGGEDYFGPTHRLEVAQNSIADGLRRRAEAWREQAEALGDMRRQLRRQRLDGTRRAWEAHRLEAIAN